MRIADILAAKGTAVAIVPVDATVRHALTELARRSIGALVVSIDGSHIEGIVSERDIVRGLDGAGGSFLQQPVSSIMSSTVRTCQLQDETDALMTTMTERRIRHVPVVDSGRLAGIVSIGDIVKTKIGELEHDRKELVDYINAR
jgi:CBS domain-containing protein